MRLRALPLAAIGVALCLGGAWAAGWFGPGFAGPAPAGDDGDDAGSGAARLSTTGAKAKPADPAEAPKARPRGAIVGTVWGATEPVAARVEAHLLSTTQQPSFEVADHVRAYLPGTPPKPLATTNAGADGRFAFEGLAAGTYEVAAFGGPAGVGRERVSVRPEGARITTLVRVLAGGETLKGRVRRADGSPWRGTVVTPPASSVVAAATFAATASTDDQGRFALPGLPAGDVVVVAAEPGTRAWTSGPVRLPRAGEWTWTLPPDVECSGLVVAASDGHPVAGATVACSGSGGTQTETALALAVTDDAGRFRFPRAAGRCSLEVTATGFRRATVYVTDPTETPTLRLVRPSLLSGRVLSDGDGAPVAGVTVTARRPSGGWESDPPSAVSAADGAYEIASLGAGECQVVATGGGWVSKGVLDARDRGYSPLVVEVPPEGRATYDVVVVRGGRVQGRVLDAAGAPVAGASVATNFPSVGRNVAQWLAGAGSVASGPDGAFALDGIPAGAMVEVTASATGYVSGKAGPFRADPAAPAETEVRLGKGTSVDVRVVDRDTKAPIAGVQLTAWSWSNDGSWSTPAPVVTGADGRARVGPLLPTRSQIQAFFGGRSGSQSVTGVAEGPVTIELEPRTSSVVAGHVAFADGPPTPGMLLEVSLEAEGKSEQNDAGEDGSFRFTGVPSGPLKLSVQLGWSQDAPHVGAEAVAGDEDVRLVFPFPRPSSIRVRVTDAAGTPVPSFQIGGAGADGWGEARDGRVDLFGVRKEAWLFVYQARSAGGAPLPLAATAAGPFPAGRSPVDVRLAAERVIEGTVRGPDGAPLRAVLLSARSLSVPAALQSAVGNVALGQARTDERGAFRIGGLGEGEYALTVSTPPEYPAPPPVPVAAGQTHVDVDLVRGAVVEVTVLSSDGKPLLGATVVARLPGQRSRLAPTGATDSSGVVRLMGLDPAGRFELRVDPPRGAGAGLSKVVAGWVPRAETVRLDPAFSIQGTFRQPDGKPLVGAGVTARSTAPGAEGAFSAQVGADGVFTFEAIGQGSYRLAATSGSPRFEGEAFADAGARDVAIVGVECPGKLAVVFEGAPADSESRWAQLMRDGARDGEGNLGSEIRDGKASFEGLRPGATYTLYASFPGGGVVYAKGIGAGTLKAPVAPGKTISGRVKGPAGVANRSVWVGGLWADATVETDGSFVVKGVPEGAWTVSASGQVGDSWWSAEAKGVEAGGSVDLELKPR